MREPHDVCMPRTQMLSLIAMGIPARDKADFSDSFRASILSARSMASFLSSSRNAFNVSFNFSASSSAVATTVRAFASPLMSSLLISRIVFIATIGEEVQLVQYFGDAEMARGRIRRLVQRRFLTERRLHFVGTRRLSPLAFRSQSAE